MDLATNWIAATEQQIKGEALDCDDAVVGLLELVAYKPEEAFEVILKIIAQNPSERVLNGLGAGPVESLLFGYPNHPAYLEQLIAKVPDVNALKQCLLYVNADDGEMLAMREDKKQETWAAACKLEAWLRLNCDE